MLRIWRNGKTSQILLYWNNYKNAMNPRNLNMAFWDGIQFTQNILQVSNEFKESFWNKCISEWLINLPRGMVTIQYFSVLGTSNFNFFCTRRLIWISKFLHKLLKNGIPCEHFRSQVNYAVPYMSTRKDCTLHCNTARTKLMRKFF